MPRSLRLDPPNTLHHVTMRSLLTGYAGAFNRRQHRVGQLSESVLVHRGCAPNLDKLHGLSYHMERISVLSKTMKR